MAITQKGKLRPGRGRNLPQVAEPCGKEVLDGDSTVGLDFQLPGSSYLMSDPLFSSQVNAGRTATVLSPDVSGLKQ